MRRQEWSRKFLELAGSAPEFPYVDESYPRAPPEIKNAYKQGSTIPDLGRGISEAYPSLA